MAINFLSLSAYFVTHTSTFLFSLLRGDSATAPPQYWPKELNAGA